MVPIYGLQKTTLLDYSPHLASTIFFGQCNLRCPYCQNYELITPDSTLATISPEEIFSHLRKRKHLLEGVCISGGEPTRYKGLPEFIRKIKELGYLVKLDTNGTNPSMLAELMDKHLIDYVAMDIKNSREQYGKTVGLPGMPLSAIEDSVSLLTNSDLSYEFRTTLVKEFHTEDDLLAIGEWLQGDSSYYLQNFRDSDTVHEKQLHSFTHEELLRFLQILLPYLPNTKIRGNF